MNPVLIRRARLQIPFLPLYLKAKDGRRFPVLESTHVLATTRLLVVLDPVSQVPIHVSPDEIDMIEYADEKSESAVHGH